MALTNTALMAWRSANTIMLSKTTQKKCQLQYDGYIKNNIYIYIFYTEENYFNK